MAGAFSLALAGCSESTIKKAASVKPASEDLGAIEHVVFLMHENRSFDHYYGTYPGVRGYRRPRRPHRGLPPDLARIRRTPLNCSPSISTP